MATQPLRKQPKQSRSRALVSSILEAAGDLLGKGSENPSDIPMQRIADRAGVGIGSVYDYFSNGEGIWDGFIDWVNERNFTALEQKVAATGSTFTERLPSLVDEALSMYLESPGRTRGIINIVVRMGWVSRVVTERDRFAHLLAARLNAEYPAAPREELDLVSEVLCDALLGVVLGELWRERDDAGRARVRQRVRLIIQREVSALQAQYPRG